MTNDPTYQKLVRPLMPEQEVRDAEFYIRNDGIIFNADGYAHPASILIGNPLYVPDNQGNRIFFGERYRKIFFYPGTTEPVPYRDRPKLLECIDPELNQYDTNPWPLQYEQVLSRSQFVGYIPGEHAFQAALADSSRNEMMLRDLENLEHLLGFDMSVIEVAFTGALALGEWKSYHDLDIVFRGDIATNRVIADTMRQLLLADPERRLHEGGKAWMIRFYNDFNVIMCTFFGYQDVADAPLRDLRMIPLENDMQIRGTVANADHALYTPTIVYLHDIKVVRINGNQLDLRMADGMPLIIHHTGSRGELNIGDKVWAHGGFMEVTLRDKKTEALVVIEREGVRNETPPWPDYYSAGRFL